MKDSADTQPSSEISAAMSAEQTAAVPAPVSATSASAGVASGRANAQTIQPLSDEVIHLMAAGEVIDSMAAVVRELVENALDARADRITISLWPERWQVRVVDNGTGLAPADLAQAAKPHTTSKISSRPDLLNIRSLGFRGEALHSIAQLAQLEICSCPPQTCHAGEPGYQVSYLPNGEIGTWVEKAVAPGTVVTVSDLFHSWQARRQVPSAAAQLKAIVPLVQTLALCHPQVTWQLQKNDQPWFSLWPGETAKSLMCQTLRKIHSADIDEISTENLYLAICLPDRGHRRRPDWVQIAINGRPVEVEALSQTLIDGFRRTIPRDRFPICFLHLRVPPTQLDWNRHPAKSEIYIQGLPELCDRTAAALGQLLQLDDLSTAAQTHRATALIKAAESAGEYAIPSRAVDIDASTDSPLDQTHLPSQNLSDTLPGTGPNALTAVAQVSQMYILAEHEGGICLIEQHIAHERVLFEQLQAHWDMQPLDAPIVLSDLTDAQKEQLSRIELTPEPFGENLWAIRQLPAPLVNRPDREAALIELSLGADLESALVATACRTAIRNGQPLELAEMQALLNQWQRTQKPRTCPHGRPICLTLKESSLAKYFRRSWVIGKSHGLA